jgi:deazaflavin-dependent oxidoreductase (nitroreductase family)
VLRRTATLAGAVVLGFVTLGIGFVLGMRGRSPWLLDAVRRFNRAVSNPQQMKSAGTPGAYASLLRHTGRTSGRPYATPVGAVATEDGFVIALVYGRNTDWLKNVLASGSATLVHEGRTYRVDQPEVAAIVEAAAYLSANDRRFHRWFGVDLCLRLRRVEPRGASGRPADPLS